MRLSHKQLSAWYLQLAQLLEAGVGLVAAIDGAAGPPQTDRSLMARRLEDGESVDAMLDHAAAWLPQADRLFMKAAARSGQLPQTLHDLSERHARIGRTQTRCLLACLYPFGVLHFAILVHAFLRQINWEVGFKFSALDFWGSLLIPIVVLWGLLFLIYSLVKSGNGLIRWFTNWLPGLSTFVRSQRIVDLALALKGLLDAGLPIGESWTAACGITGDKRLQRAGEAIRAGVERGEPPSQHLARQGCFPADFISLYTSGERSGQLDQALASVARNYQTRADTGLTVTMVLYPALVFVGVAFMIAVQVISFYAGYFGRLNDLMQ